MESAFVSFHLEDCAGIGGGLHGGGLAHRSDALSSCKAEDLNENAGLLLKNIPRCNSFAPSCAEGWQAGDTLRQPVLARALRCLAEEGLQCFNTGWIPYSGATAGSKPCPTPGAMMRRKVGENISQSRRGLRLYLIVFSRKQNSS